MKPASPEQVLFAEALQRATPEARAAYLEGACGTNTALRQRVEALLRAAANAGDFLEEPPTGLSGDADSTSPANELSENPGDRIGRYKLLEQIGEGGCGVVYMAEQEEPVRRRVALKVIKLGMDTQQVIARFEAERQALALMDHPNIAKVLDGGATPTGRPYFVMELVRGVRITEFCDETRLSTEARLRLFVLVCQAVQHAHQKGIIHRDLKPSNILVTVNDGAPVPKVIDFGIAKATGQRLTDKTVFTQFHSFIGTPAYTSPEQAEMSSVDIDTRSDIYSLGVLLYELLIGRTPFDGEELLRSGLDEMRRVLRETEPVRPSTRLGTLRSDELTTSARRRQTEPPKLIHLVRGDLDWIVMKALEKDRTRRYETASGLAGDVQRHLDNEPVIARPPSTAYKLQKAWRRNKLAFTAAAAVLCALMLGVVVSTWQAVRATQAEREQSRERQEAEEARRNEAVLRQQAETRENLAKAQLLCQQLRFDEAKALMSRIPASYLQSERRGAAIVFTALADSLACRGRWKEALPHATRAVECDPADMMNYVSLLVLLGADGDLENHRRYCREFLDRFRQPEEVYGERIAKACLFVRTSGTDLAIVEKLADASLTAAAAGNDLYLSYHQFAKGLTEYRQGRFASASDWMRKSIDDPFYGHGHSRYVQAYMVLAMAQQQLKRPEEARAAFAKGIEIAETKLPKLDGGDHGAGWYWRDWIIAHALMNEAKALIDGQPAGSTKLKPESKPGTP